MNKNDDVINLFQTIFALKRSRGPIFADIMKIVTKFLKKISEDSKKVKRNRKYVSRCNLYQYFLIQQNLLIFEEKLLMLAEVKSCVT